MLLNGSKLVARMSQSGYPRDWLCITRSVLLLMVLLLGGASTADAQLLRGRLISSSSRAPMVDATVDLLDSESRVTQTTRTDSSGRFYLGIGNRAQFRLRVRRVGIEPTVTDPILNQGLDTLEIELLVDERITQLQSVEVEAQRDANALRMAEARTKGWRVVPPERVAVAKRSAQQMEQLLRGVSLSNVMIERDCVRSLISNGCLTIFIDDQYFGQRGMNMINPRDIEFIAVIGPADAVATFGNRAQYGVLMLYTTRFADTRRNDRRP